MAKAHLLSEIAEKVNQSERCHKICHLLFQRVLKAANVRVQVLHDDRVPPREAVESQLNIWKVINIGRVGGGGGGGRLQ